MSLFQAVNGANIEDLEPYFAASPNRICDNTTGVTFQWRNIYHTAFALAGGCMVTRSIFKDLGPCYSVPLGPGDPSAAFALIEADAREQGAVLRFACVGEDQLPLLASRYTNAMTAEEMRDWADYLYDVENFEYVGKKHHGQKNHVNRFYKEFPEARCVEITQDMFPDCQAFLRQVEAESAPFNEIERNEMQGTMDLIEIYCCLNQKAACLMTRLGITALAVGEVRGDTLFVHGEKARRIAPGAYPAMAQAFVRFMGKEFAYVNREDDGGDEGIRFSKLNYKPLMLIPKYLVTVH
ncbi:MAG: DUF2156 domain-containing protein [Clostridia bacterium]|nr:DUF2156 domain-containing protein [Clostridia bacterium]